MQTNMMSQVKISHVKNTYTYTSIKVNEMNAFRVSNNANIALQ